MKENDKPPVSRAEAAATSTAHARINVPLNLDNWRHLPESVATELTWLHQYLLSEGLSWEEAEKIVGFDRSTIYRVLKGTYEGNWENVAAKVGSLRRTVALQAAVQKTVFVETPQAKQIFWILDYTLGKSGVSFLIGPGGVGKTFAVKEWLRRHNHGRAVLVEAYPVGGAKLMLRSIAHAVGVNKNYSIPQLIEAVERAFDSTRMIIVDEVQHYVPCDPRSRPVAIECLRRIHDTTGCALALIGTAAARAEMERSTNFYEQLIRRAGKPFYIVDKFTPADIRPIAAQFVPNPSDEFLNLLTA
ncbi:MAG: AAA family ATPase, partial [Verrucomicrobiae bacterium]|nr:AAA family ATPase [Verrucomicrobiae bacterium]